MSEKQKQIPLSRVIAVVAQARTQLRKGASTNSIIAPLLAELPPVARPLTQAIIYESIRINGLSNALLQTLCSRRPTDEVVSLLEAAFAALHLKHTTDFTVVNETVEAAKKQPATRMAAGFINAVLRRYLREKEALHEELMQYDEIRYNAPAWWIDKICECYPSQWRQILEVSATHPPLTLRINRRKTTVDEYLKQLEEARIDAVRVGRDAVQLLKPVPVHEIPGFEQGLCSVQDAGAQLAGHLLKINNGDRVLDACAAPGGKTAHLLEQFDCRMTAMEISPRRAERIKETLDRLELKADIVVADAAEPQEWWDGNCFDAILLDAPCTASGVVRRQPDTPWIRREEDIRGLARQQQALLHKLWPLLKAGGKLLYATCSIFPEEGTEQILDFVADTEDAELLPLCDENRGMMVLTPCEAPYDGKALKPGVHDGFFYALLQKKA